MHSVKTDKTILRQCDMRHRNSHFKGCIMMFIDISFFDAEIISLRYEVSGGIRLHRLRGQPCLNIYPGIQGINTALPSSLQYQTIMRNDECASANNQTSALIALSSR